MQNFYPPIVLTDSTTPGLTLLLQTTNYLVHGISSPIGVAFMGGTMVNLLFVYGYVPSGVLSISRETPESLRSKRTPRREKENRTY